MELPEDNVEDFEVLVEYIFHHSAGDRLSVSNSGRDTIECCLSFLEYADKYNLGDVSGGLYEPIRNALEEYGSSVFKPEHIETVFCLTKDGNYPRELMAEAALAFQDNYASTWKAGTVSFERQEREVEGFQCAIYQALKRMSFNYQDPFKARGHRRYFVP